MSFELNYQCPLSGVKRTSLIAAHMSASDPADIRLHRSYVLVCRVVGHRPKCPQMTGESYYLYLTTSFLMCLQLGHSNVRLSWLGFSGSIRSSHILTPHFGQGGWDRTSRVGSKVSDCDMVVSCRCAKFAMLFCIWPLSGYDPALRALISALVAIRLLDPNEIPWASTSIT
jgi:hypothetical protein